MCVCARVWYNHEQWHSGVETLNARRELLNLVGSSGLTYWFGHTPTDICLSTLFWLDAYQRSKSQVDVFATTPHPSHPFLVTSLIKEITKWQRQVAILVFSPTVARVIFPTLLLSSSQGLATTARSSKSPESWLLRILYSVAETDASHLWMLPTGKSILLLSQLTSLLGFRRVDNRLPSLLYAGPRPFHNDVLGVVNLCALCFISQ